MWVIRETICNDDWKYHGKYPSLKDALRAAITVARDGARDQFVEVFFKGRDPRFQLMSFQFYCARPPQEYENLYFRALRLFDKAAEARKKSSPGRWVKDGKFEKFVLEAASAATTFGFSPTPRCYFCNTEVLYPLLECPRCGGKFCIDHRLPDQHGCSGK